MKRIGVLAKPDKPDARRITGDLTRWLTDRGREVVLDRETAALIGEVDRGVPKGELPGRSDLLIVLGGDGTLLSVARLVGNLDVPILGINLGGLGFLTATTLEEMTPTLDALFAGNYVVEERMMLHAQVNRQGKGLSEYLSLNDVVINKGAHGGIIDLEVWINGEYGTAYRADGLIISTATGSTAYSLSAGGPILFPTMDAVLLTPICSHTLTNRPLVLPADVTLGVTLLSEHSDVILSLDGQVNFGLKGKDTVEVRRAPNRIKLIRMPKKNFFQVIRQKLKWGER